MKKLDYYVIDSSSLIELNLKYPMDVFPTLWANVEKLIQKGFLISPREVLNEISKKDDDLKKWAMKQTKMFKELNANQAILVKQILKEYPALAKPENQDSVADPFVIALAIDLENDSQTTLIETVKKRIVVTEERLRGLRIKIPFVSQKYGIDCINVLEMCRIEGWKF